MFWISYRSDELFWNKFNNLLRLSAQHILRKEIIFNKLLEEENIEILRVKLRSEVLKCEFHYL